MSKSLRAVDVKRIPTNVLSWDRLLEGVAVSKLPTCLVHEPEKQTEAVAIVSWRWDLNSLTGRSRNLAFALKHAQETEVERLFLDVVSVDQTLCKDDLLRAVVALANLFECVPVIAVYDEPSGARDTWSRTLQRPWILSEIRAFSKNSTHVTNIGLRHSDTDANHLSFANEVSAIRSSGYAACVLEILHGRVAMTDIADFRWILAEFSDVILACFQAFGRGDYLLAVFLLTAGYERRQVVERGGHSADYGFRTNVGSMHFDQFGLERFTLVASDEHIAFGYAKTLLLDGQPVAIWRSRMTSSFDRNWIEVLPVAEACILEAADVSADMRSVFGARSEFRTTFLQIDKDAATPRIRERAVNATRGGWMAKVPRPQATSLGFDPGLWRVDQSDFG